MSYEPQKLEADWRQRWAESGRYEADPDGRTDDDATFVTVPYPYPSGGMHIGHARTYTVPDVYARYRRQQGDNVLFPIGWHVTGTPIVGAVERLKKGDEAQIDSLQNAFGVSEDDLRNLETPMGYARYFIEEADCSYKTGMQQLGLSIDWRREFTTNDERYQRFITWQYETLRERGLLEKGLHPVKYCTEQKNPVTTHDLLEGETVEYQEYTLVKFAGSAGDDGDTETIFPMATLRPETVRGVTNAYIDPEGTYVEAKVNDERWVISTEAAEKLELQERDVEILAERTGDAYVGQSVSNPITGNEVLILPASFVDPDSGTGVVMSVPAHSPDDYLALAEAKADRARLESYGLDPAAVGAIEPRAILTVEGYGEIPARDAVESAGITESDDPDLKEVTQQLYNREFHQGELNDEYGEYAGAVVEAVREELKAHFQGQGAFDTMYDFPEPVISRAGGKVVVANQETWFLRYNDEAWKGKVREAIAQLDAIPENTREQYEHTVGWLQEWPCIRNYGLGTPLPWDTDFIIEPLSDSTIYMSYYTVAHLLADIPAEELTTDFFDTLLLGEGDHQQALELREEWDYWYPIDYRCSGPDLVSNHLTFFLYHHAELFDSRNWPEGITVMGMGLLEGEKMSSSKGHVVLPNDAVDRYGADTVRFFLLNSSEPWQDFDWRADEVGTTRDQLDRFWNRARGLIDGPNGERDLERIDRWLLANLQETVEEATAAMERFETRTASQVAFYQFEEKLKWYRRRTDTERAGARFTLQTVLETRLRLLAPFIPFMANELHERLTGEPADDVPWPAVVPEFEDEAVLAEETLVEGLLEDVRDIVGVTDTDPETIRVYTAASWKGKVFDQVIETGPDIGAVMGQVMQNEALREKGNQVNDLVQELVSFAREHNDAELETLLEVDETAVYEASANFLAEEFDADVEVYREDDDPVDPADKARHAKPFRPAIHLE